MTTAHQSSADDDENIDSSMFPKPYANANANANTNVKWTQYEQN